VRVPESTMDERKSLVFRIGLRMVQEAVTEFVFCRIVYGWVARSKDYFV
jgi:hypothetical protein